MIKVPLTLTELDRLAEKHYRTVIRVLDLRTQISGRAIDYVTPLFSFILPRLKKIIVGRPEYLESLIPMLDPIITNIKNAHRAANPGISNRSLNSWFNKVVKTYFNYDNDHNSFCRVDNKKHAYAHALAFGMNTCPYCNAQFTFTLKKKEKGSRPTFDHFLSKSKHPYFALSFFNLIPSCAICNSGLKSNLPFSCHTHVHPFIESAHDVIEFKTNIKAADYLVNRSDFKIKIKAIAGADPARTTKAENSAKAFYLADRYNFHRDYAGEIIERAYMYTNSKIKELYEDYKVNGVSIFKDEHEIIERILGNFVRPEFLHKRILSKITKDIAKEVGLPFP